MRMLRGIVALTALALLLVVAPTALAQDGATVGTTDHDTYGEILVGPDGMTLYVFGDDEAGVSNCTEGCAENWPPLTVEEGTEATLAEGVDGTVSTIERADGSMQVTYNDMPLYHFARDSAAGDTEGQGVGDNWYVVPVGATSFSEAHEMSEGMTEDGDMAAADDEMAEDEEMTEDDAAETEEGEEPEQLPATGATDSLPWMLALLGVLLIAAAGTLRAAPNRS